MAYKLAVKLAAVGFGAVGLMFVPRAVDAAIPDKPAPFDCSPYAEQANSPGVHGFIPPICEQPGLEIARDAAEITLGTAPVAATVKIAG